MHAKIADRQGALETCRSIGMALGIVMHQHAATADAAFAMLRSISRKLREIAADVVATGALTHPRLAEDRSIHA